MNAGWLTRLLRRLTRRKLPTSARLRVGGRVYRVKAMGR